MSAKTADLVLTNGRITTLDPAKPRATAVAMRDGRFLAVGNDEDIAAHIGAGTTQIDLEGRRVIPGLQDSHTHVIRGGLHYNTELRWDGVTSLADALEMLRIQAERTPSPQWVRVVGGWSEFQFAERRMPTIDEVNAAAPNTPVFILHLYARAILNRAALKVLGYDENPPAFDRGIFERDDQGRPTGMLVAKPSALILYKSLSQAPRLPVQDQINSTRQFMRELNRLGVTSVIDAGGGGQNYPEDYEVIRQVNEEGYATLRVSYNLFAQTPGVEYDDYARWVDMTGPGDGDDMLKTIGAGENLVWAAADFENFLEPQPELNEHMEPELEKVVRLLAERRWPFRIHATYDESISRFLDVFEKVNEDTSLDGLHWIIDHAETISERSIDRVVELGGGIAIQHRMAFQGEFFLERYGREALRGTPPLRKMLESGVAMGAGTDATRVASYNPWVGLSWLTTGRTVGGLAMYGEDNLLTREEALRLWTIGSAWFSSDETDKGLIAEGMLADLAVLNKDYFVVADADIKDLESVMTVVDGKVVYAAEPFGAHGPPELPVSPEWSPVALYPGYGGSRVARAEHKPGCPHHHAHAHGHDHGHPINVFHEHVDAAKQWLKTPFAHGWTCDCFVF
jgi:predicted amidohydrolase YtcJ